MYYKFYYIYIYKSNFLNRFSVNRLYDLIINYYILISFSFPNSYNYDFTINLQS